MGFYNYKGRSVGRVMHFLYDIYHVIQSDRFVFSNGKIYESHFDCENGNPIMEYMWFGTTDVPLLVPYGFPNGEAVRRYGYSK